MSDINVVENKISSVKKYLNILEDFQKYSKEEIQEDIHIKGSLERYLYLVVQACIDLAGAVVSYKDLRKPIRQKESFVILKENNIISEDLKSKLIKMVGFRNVIAHDYGDIDEEIVYNVLHNRLKDIKNFLKIISKIK